MAVEPNDIIQAIHEMVMTDGSIHQNGFFYRYVGASSQADADVMTAIATGLDNLYTDLSTLISDQMVINPMIFNIVEWQIAVQKWVKTRELGFETMTWTPANIGDPFPNQVAAVLSGETLVPRRTGRKFFGGFAETSAIAGELTAGALAALAAAGVDYMAQLPLGGGDVLLPVVLATNASNADGIIAVVANSILGSQRRRKPGVGV